MKFGVALPTCTEGMAYPLPFCDHEGVLAVAERAEALGFDSVLANDHLSTQGYVRQLFADPPRYYEPLTSLAWLAGRTSRVRLMTGVVVLPLREPVLLAKQVATLDQISGGRLTLGVGVGGYREEFESVRPRERGLQRAVLMEEGLQALRMLFDQRRATMDGAAVAFQDIELHPKPLQPRLPIYSSGNADGTLRRAAAHCDGWMPAALPLPRLVEGITRLHDYAAQAGRDPATLVVAPQLSICVAATQGQAEEVFRRSQVHEHLVSLQQSTLRGLDIDAYVTDNLIGTPELVRQRVAALAEVGVTELPGLLVVASTLDELLAQLEVIAEEILPAFEDPPATEQDPT